MIDATDEVIYLHRKAKRLLKEKLSEEDVVFMLKTDGINEDYARLVVENIKQDSINRYNGVVLTIAGSVAIIAGLIVYFTPNPLSVNSPSSSFKIICGLSIAGALSIAKGVASFKKTL